LNRTELHQIKPSFAFSRSFPTSLEIITTAAMAEPNKYAQSLDKFYNVFDGPATFFRGTCPDFKKLPSKKYFTIFVRAHLYS
jgi:hypothetical protein